jgi:multiple sugar transport system ATP-binding protein
MNLFEASVNADLSSVNLGSQKIVMGSDVVASHPGLTRYADRSIVVGIRPEDLHAASDARPGEPFTGEVEVVEALGSELLVHFSTDAHIIQPESATKSGSDGTSDEGIEASVDCVARIEPRHLVRIGDKFTFSIDPNRLEFFDTTDGTAIWD